MIQWRITTQSVPDATLYAGRYVPLGYHGASLHNNQFLMQHYILDEPAPQPYYREELVTCRPLLNPESSQNKTDI